MMRISLNSFLAALFLIVSPVIFSSCGSESPPSAGDATSPSPSGSATVRPGSRELVVATFRDGALDELDAASYNGPQFLFKMIYDGLVEDAGNGRTVPALATSWEISEDGREYVFHLREGVKFSDGTDFDADAVVINMKRWTGNDRYAALASNKLSDIEAVDRHTVRMVFEAGEYSILNEQTYPRPVRYLSPASIEPDPGNPVGRFTAPVGTGPWMLESYDKEKEYVLVPNPHYWGEKPKLDRIRFKVVGDSQARVMALRSGEVDIIGGDLMGKIPIESVPELTGDPAIDVVITDTMCSHMIVFNNDDGKFADRNLRLAINHAIDKKAVTADLFDGIGKVADGFFQPSVPYVTPENNYGYPGDKGKAARLLDEGGYIDSDGDGVRERDGKPLEYNFVLSTGEFPEWKVLAEFVQAELAQVGIKINLNILDRNGFYETTQSTRMFDLALMRTPNDSWMPHSSLMELFGPYPTPGRPARVWTEPKLLPMIAETLATLDVSKRQGKYDELFGYISSEVLAVPIYYPVVSFAYNPKRVRNFEVGVNSFAPINWESLDVGDDT
ncbi:MAG: ABC transporter substrate-binding protein [Deltaproteobacteria bacterium]|jgi:peptide/nickel transport system substrate-binding protein|nr:ABC transporter substrate-binding protein [Deltaproteobacteria bacterium]